jgi:hypothetical protein
MPAEAGIQSFRIHGFPLKTCGNDEKESDHLRNPE